MSLNELQGTQSPETCVLWSVTESQIQLLLIFNDLSLVSGLVVCCDGDFSQWTGSFPKDPTPPPPGDWPRWRWTTVPADLQRPGWLWSSHPGRGDAPPQTHLHTCTRIERLSISHSPQHPLEGDTECVWGGLGGTSVHSPSTCSSNWNTKQPERRQSLHCLPSFTSL